MPDALDSYVPISEPRATPVLVPPAAASARERIRRSIVGGGPAIQSVWRQVETVAPTDISVLLIGESGTGKELFAHALHDLSPRAGGPFIAVDCASIPVSLIEAELFGHEKGAFTDAKEARQGKFEQASGGTIFFDELGNLPLEVQAKLLRVVQERAFRRLGGSALVEVDVRIVCATNADLRASMLRQSFRPDLFYRLAEMSILVPPLRDRSEDLPALVARFVAEYGATFHKRVTGPSPITAALLEQHDWPGNIRELRNVIRAATLLAGDVIEPEHLPAYFPRAGRLTADGAAPGEPDAGSPFADDAACEYRFHFSWGERDDGLDLKELHRRLRRDLDRHILASLRRAGLNKAQIARYLRLDYKVLLGKFKELAPPEPVTTTDPAPDRRSRE